MRSRHRVVLARLAPLALAAVVGPLAVVAGLVGCRSGPSVDAPAPAGGRPVAVALAGETMGSTWHVKIVVEPDGVAAARAMHGAIQKVLDGVDGAMSTWKADSEISRFNAHASTAPFPVSAETAAVVAKALDVGRRTGGAFDITIDPLINLWGFDRGGKRDAPPSAAEIAAAKEHTGLHLVEVATASGGPALVKRDPLVTLNLGGIASGHGVDRVTSLLVERGFADVLVEVTGEVKVHGTNAGGEPWRIGVNTPEIDEGGVLQAIPLVAGPGGRALTTSGSYRTFFEAAGHRYSHILDPRTGAPVETDLVSVTVLFDDALTADGFDTPFVILGEERARQIMKGIPGMEALFIHLAADGSLRTTRTAGFPDPA